MIRNAARAALLTFGVGFTCAFISFPLTILPIHRGGLFIFGTLFLALFVLVGEEK